MADLQMPVLHEEGTGVFRGVGDATLRRVCQCATVRTYRRGEQLFAQGDATDEMPVYVILSGEFEVHHLTPYGRLVVSVDLPGVVTAEVEYLTRGIGPEVTERGEKDRAKATLVCRAQAEVLVVEPAAAMFDLQEPRLLLNVARLLAIKLLRRNARSDPAELRPGPQEMLYSFLSEAFARDDWVIPLESDRYQLLRFYDRAQMAHMLGCNQTSINSIYGRRLRHQGLSWKADTLIITREFRWKLTTDWRKACNETVFRRGA